MERVRRSKSKVPTAFEGSRQSHKQITVLKLGSDSSSYSGGTINKHTSYSRRVIGTPIKKLLEEEMLKENEVKRRSPSVIAKLMGLDGLPSPQSVRRRSLESCQNMTASKDSPRRCLPHNQSGRMISMEHEEFKDVYEDLEASHVMNQHHSSKWNMNSRLVEQDMAFIQGRSYDAKHISSLETFQGPKEFYDSLNMLDFDDDILIKCHQRPDLLSAKHPVDLQVSPSSTLSSQIEVLKPSNSAKCATNCKRRNCEREYPLKRDGGSICGHSYDRYSAYDSINSSKICVEGNHDKDILPTRIVVLKPNLGKKCNVDPYDRRKHAECSGVGVGRTGSWGKRDLSNDMVSQPRSREAREMAKEITRQMKENFYGRPSNLLYSGITGYVGDKITYDAAGSDSLSESEVTTMTSKNSFAWKNQCESSSSHSAESSISKEAKKRLSERWKMAQRRQNVGVSNRSSTLGEMLAVSDKEMLPQNMGAKMCLNESREEFSGCNVTTSWEGPLGISSRDGWKDGYFNNISRPRSLAPPSTSCKSHKSFAGYETLVDESYLIPKETSKRGRSKTVRGHFNQKTDISSKSIKSSSKRSHSSHRRSTISIDSSMGCHIRQIHTQAENEKMDPSEHQPMVCNFDNNDVNRTCSPSNAAGDTEHASILVTSESSADKVTMFESEAGNPLAIDREDSNPQKSSLSLPCLVPEPESSESSKEADHPSPVSVLGLPFSEDVSSGSECFERVSAELHELRLQLQLLKMESKAYDEAPTSSDTDVGQESAMVFEEEGIIAADSWESSYLLDVLTDSGFDETDLENYMTTWHSLDHPLDPWICQNLEKKYDNETTVLRSDRKLMFDRINVALLEVFQQFMDSRPWLKPEVSRNAMKWQIRGVKDELNRLLGIGVREGNKAGREKVMDKEMQWIDSGEDIDVIGKEIEKMLINDLLMEVVDVTIM